MVNSVKHWNRNQYQSPTTLGKYSLPIEIEQSKVSQDLQCCLLYKNYRVTKSLFKKNPVKNPDADNLDKCTVGNDYFQTPPFNRLEMIGTDEV